MFVVQQVWFYVLLFRHILQQKAESILVRGNRVILLAEHLDDYILTPELSSPQETAVDQLHFMTDDHSVELLISHVNLYAYGCDIIKEDNAVLSPYPNLAEQDTQYIPKSIEDGGKNLTLSDIQWQTDNTANMDGYAVADRYTAVATYTGSTTSSYVKGYTVTADYTGTVSRIALNRVRYVAIFEGVPIQPAEPAKTAGAMSSLRWSYVLIPIGVVAAAGAGVGGAPLVKRKRENADEEETEE